MPARMTKDWDKFGTLLTTELPAKLVKKGHDVLIENARIYQETVVEMILEDMTGTRELSDGWFYDKMRRDGETENFRFKDQFLDYMMSDQSMKYVKGRYANSKVFVGARSDVTHTREYGKGQATISYETLLRVLQEDYDRPLFSTALEFCKWEIQDNWKQILEALTGW